MEGLRHTGGVIGKMPRWSHEPIKYKGWTIPADTIFSCVNTIIHQNPAVFPDPFAYRPERWIEAEKNGVKLDRYLVPFSVGSRQCIGINLGEYLQPSGLLESYWHSIQTDTTLFTAWAELYLTLATIVMKFDFEIYDTDWKRDVKIDMDYFVGVPSKQGRGVRVKITETF